MDVFTFTEWLDSDSHSDRHRRAARGFCTLSGREQLVHGVTNVAGTRQMLVVS